MQLYQLSSVKHKMAFEMIGRQLDERRLIWDRFLACSML